MNYSRYDSPAERDRTPVNNFDTSRWDISNNDYVDYQRGSNRVVQRDNVNFQSPDGRQYFHIDHATFIMGGNCEQRRYGSGQSSYMPDWDDRPSYRDMTYQNMIRQQQLRAYDGDYRYGDPSQWASRPVYRQPYQDPRWDYDRGYRATGYSPRTDAAWAGPGGVGVVSSGGWDDGYRDPNPIRQFNREVGMPLAETAAVVGVIGNVVNMIKGGGRGYYGNQWSGNGWGNQWSRGWGNTNYYGNQWNNNWQYANGPSRYNWGNGFSWG